MSLVLRRSSLVLVLAGLALSGVSPLSAQITVKPKFPVGPGALVEVPVTIDVGVASDGSILFAWTGNPGNPHVSLRRMSAAGTSLGAPQALLDSPGSLRGISANAGGGYIIAYDLPNAIGGAFGRRLTTIGSPDDFGFPVSDVIADGVTATTVAALPTGSVFVWEQADQFHARLFDTAGQPRGPSLLIETLGQGVVGTASAVAAMPDGGFVAMWSWFGMGLAAHARVYDADGTPRTPILTVGGGLVFPNSVAASPLGGFVVAGSRFVSFEDTTSVLAFRFANDGTPLGETELQRLPAGVLGIADLAFDSAGNALVVWSEFQFDGAPGGYLRNRGRGIAPDGTPIARPFLVADAPARQAQIARLPDDTFANAWLAGNAVEGSVVALCTPDRAVCGDGVLMAACEECDDGAGNSDTAPDACRADCGLPRCGDGVVDVAHGEECEDGNAERCDGCSPECRLEIGLVCGDGAVVPGCGTDQCDDGNLVIGDGCDPSCTLESIPGGGSAGTDCDTTWTVDNPGNLPLHDKAGAFSALQVCTDGDPSCDFDGGVAGSCTFRIKVCANVTAFERCEPPTRLASWVLKSPSASKAATHPALAPIRTAFGPVPGAIVGPDQRDVCTDWLAVPLALRGGPTSWKKAKLSLTSVATSYEGGRDTDKLKLVCLPGS